MMEEINDLFNQMSISKSEISFDEIIDGYPYYMYLFNINPDNISNYYLFKIFEYLDPLGEITYNYDDGFDNYIVSLLAEFDYFNQLNPSHFFDTYIPYDVRLKLINFLQIFFHKVNHQTLNFQIVNEYFQNNTN